MLEEAAGSLDPDTPRYAELTRWANSPASGLDERFAATLLLRAAGRAGWVILFDEVELIGRYPLLQRGRSYAELARWLGGGKTARAARRR